MRKKLFVLFSSLLLVALLSACVPNPQMQSIRQISLTGKGEVYVVPDIAYVYIGVRTQSENVAEALAQNNTDAQDVAAKLQELGVAPEDIQTTSFNVFPQQEYGPNGEVLRTVYVVENTVYVKVRELGNLGQMLDQVVRTGANSINGVSFDVENREQYAADARQKAIEDLRNKAQEMAAAAGVELGELQNLSIYSTYVPVPVYEGKGGGMASQGGSPVAAGQLVISVEASGSYAIK